MLNRRSFIASTGAIAAAAIAPSSIITLANTPQPGSGKPTLPELPYAYEALEPFIDAETMKLHHTKHHQAYINGLIKAEEELQKARETGDFALVQHWSKQAAFHGGGHFLHSMFWKVMAPKAKGGGSDPSGNMANMIRENFGSLDAFKKQFSATAVAVEGSGWALLHYKKDEQRLIILQAENQHKLSSWGTTPVLGIDVWEHAYYLKYQNKRADYVTAWWNVVNWAQVEKNILAV